MGFAALIVGYPLMIDPVLAHVIRGLKLLVYFVMIFLCSFKFNLILLLVIGQECSRPLADPLIT